MGEVPFLISVVLSFLFYRRLGKGHPYPSPRAFTLESEEVFPPLPRRRRGLLGLFAQKEMLSLHSEIDHLLPGKRSASSPYLG